VHSNLFVTTDTEGSDGVAGLACEGETLVQVATKLESRKWESYCKQEFDHSIVPTP
jgi:hypothetical protein